MVWGLGGDYATARVLVLETLAYLNKLRPGVLITTGQWLFGLTINDYGGSPHVDIVSAAQAIDNLSEAYLHFKEPMLRRKAIGATILSI